MERSADEPLPKKTLVGVGLLRLLSEEGHRVFRRRWLVNSRRASASRTPT